MEYLSCAPTALYRTKGFYDPPEVLAGLRGTERQPGSAIEFLGKVFDCFRYVRMPPDRLLASNPETLDPVLKTYATYNENYRDGAPAILVRIKDCFVHSNVLYVNSPSGVRPIYETHRPNDRPYVPLVDPLAHPYPVEKVEYAGAANFFIGSAGTANYGHWLVDDLPRAAAIPSIVRHRRRSHVQVWVSESGNAQMDRVRAASLQAMCASTGAGAASSAASAAPTVDVKPMRLDRIYRFDELYFVTPVSYHPSLKSPDAMASLSGRFSGRSSGRYGKRLLVSRRAARGRNLLNSEAVEGALGGLGFAVVDTEAMSFSEQVDAFAGAEIVVGLMGAAMTNTVFAARGTAVVYLSPEGWVEPFYWDLASVCQHRYHACYGPAADPAVAPYLSDFSLDLRLVEETVAPLVAHAADFDPLGP